MGLSSSIRVVEQWKICREISEDKSLAKRLLELKDLQNICVFSVFASRFNTFYILAYSFKVHYLRVNWASSSWRSGLGARLRRWLPGSSTVSKQQFYFQVKVEVKSVLRISSAHNNVRTL
jgi:hypothetical protein